MSLKTNSMGISVNDDGTEVRYLTDNRDSDHPKELVIQLLEGDIYVSVVPPGEVAIFGVRLCTSGGASFHCRGLTSAMHDAFMAIKKGYDQAPAL